MVVKLTQEQADFLKTFVCNDRAFHYISRYGWNHYLKDGNGKCYENSEEYVALKLLGFIGEEV